jgi:two-component system sensor histidine kinase BaeS
MKRDSCRRGGPPWWPTSEPWPTRPGRFGVDRRARVRFFRRIVLAGFSLLGFALAAVLTAAWLIAQRFGPMPTWAPPLAGLVVLFAAGTVLVRMFGAMRRFVSPLGQVMDAADRVAEGDYSVRVQEQGPPPMRALAHSFNTMTERLQHADRIRRDLMADLAHELRTPLTVVQGRLEGLLDGIYPRDDRQIAEVLHEAHVLSRLIDDLRTLALSDAGALPLQKEPTDSVALVQDVVRGMQTEARRKPVTLNVNAPPGEILTDVDPVRIREVITNLLSNAIRHTPAGGAVTVSIAQSDGNVAVTVADTGEGISADEVGRIFDRFYKGPASQGSGLGLSIAKGIVTAHGGDIEAVSEGGKGTTVSFTIPQLDSR